MILKYHNPDKLYKSHKIKIKKENNKLLIKGEFTNKENNYIILEKFLEKKVYKLKKGYNYINNCGLSGDYSIYIKINNKIYKTNKYVTF